jgi:hypothetical protein
MLPGYPGQPPKAKSSLPRRLCSSRRTSRMRESHCGNRAGSAPSAFVRGERDAMKARQVSSSQVSKGGWSESGLSRHLEGMPVSSEGGRVACSIGRPRARFHRAGADSSDWPVGTPPREPPEAHRVPRFVHFILSVRLWPHTVRIGFVMASMQYVHPSSLVIRPFTSSEG